MAVSGIEWHWFGGVSSQSIDINIPPADVGAAVAFRGVSGGGLHHTGIQRYRKRLPSGADETIDFGTWPRWPPAVFDRMSSVTFALALGANQEAYVLARMDYWS